MRASIPLWPLRRHRDWATVSSSDPRAIAVSAPVAVHVAVVAAVVVVAAKVGAKDLAPPEQQQVLRAKPASTKVPTMAVATMSSREA